MNTYKIEKNTLIKHINNTDLIQLFKDAKCFIAGGAITSIFSGKEINDVDIYFRNYESLLLVLRKLFATDDHEDLTNIFSSKILNNDDVSPFSLIYTNHTKKSILFTKDDLKVQLIYFKFFNSVQEIFDTFDFTINMGAYDCETAEFVLDDRFLKDIAARRLSVNTNTYYPIVSMLRIDKYKQKGYEISRKDFVNLCLAVNKLQIKNWDDASNAIGGMYGYTSDSIFDTTKEFSIEDAIDQLHNIESNLDYIPQVAGVEYYSFIQEIKKNLGITDTEPLLFYKKVLNTQTPNIFKSIYSPNFTYEINNNVNGGNNGIWAYKSILGAKQHYNTSSNKNESIIVLQPTEKTTIAKDSSNTYKLYGDVKVLSVLNENEE